MSGWLPVEAFEYSLERQVRFPRRLLECRQVFRALCQAQPRHVIDNPGNRLVGLGSLDP